MKKFKNLSLRKEIQQWLDDQHFITMTEIQEQSIPFILQGKDIIGLSKTGSGKTHAFLVPILEQIDVSKDEVQAVITTPTRAVSYTHLTLPTILLV